MKMTMIEMTANIGGRYNTPPSGRASITASQLHLLRRASLN
jgi:hypothetical protein